MSMPVAEGEVIAGKYRVDRVLGRGGMGVVVAANHLFLPQRVAIKFLAGDSSPGLTQRFLREARAAVRLKGEHVVRVLDVGQLDSGVPYIVMEYLEGRDLSEVLRERSQLEVEEALDYVLQACVAMSEAHAAGIVHRDLKPANLFLTTSPDGARLVKVLDFGISKEMPSGAEGGGAALTQTREMLGSPLYMSPEQMRSSRSVDARSDIWSLGAILYRFLVGSPPFDATTITELVLRVTGTEPTSPRELRPDVPVEVDWAILRCLQKDPTKRPASIAELALTLAPFASRRGQECAERAARILGVTLEPPPRPTLTTVGLGLSAGTGSIPPPKSIPPPRSIPPPKSTPPPGVVPPPISIPPPGALPRLGALSSQFEPTPPSARISASSLPAVSQAPEQPSRKRRSRAAVLAVVLGALLLISGAIALGVRGAEPAELRGEPQEPQAPGRSAEVGSERRVEAEPAQSAAAHPVQSAAPASSLAEPAAAEPSASGVKAPPRSPPAGAPRGRPPGTPATTAQPNNTPPDDGNPFAIKLK